MSLVDLFGKKKLEDRILELEAGLAKLEREKDDLFRTLEKRDERDQLSAANQEANIALKAAEQRAAAVVSAPSSVLPQAGCTGKWI